MSSCCNILWLWMLLATDHVDAVLVDRALAQPVLPTTEERQRSGRGVVFKQCVVRFTTGLIGLWGCAAQLCALPGAFDCC